MGKTTCELGGETTSVCPFLLRVSWVKHPMSWGDKPLVFSLFFCEFSWVKQHVIWGEKSLAFAIFFCEILVGKIPRVLEEPPCIVPSASLHFGMICCLRSFSPMAVVPDIYPPYILRTMWIVFPSPEWRFFQRITSVVLLFKKIMF